LYQRLGRQTDQGAGIFTSIKSKADAIAKRRKTREAAERGKRSSEVIYGRPRQIKTEAVTEASRAGVRVSTNTIQIDEELLNVVPARYRGLFVSVCAVVEKSLSSEVAVAKRRQL
jgi:hypothetical protein